MTISITNCLQMISLPVDFKPPIYSIQKSLQCGYILYSGGRSTRRWWRASDDDGQED